MSAAFWLSSNLLNIMLWEPHPSYHNGLFSPLLVLEISLPRCRSISVLFEQNETSYLFYVTLSFLYNIICYLISVFLFSLVTLSGATTHKFHVPLCIFQVTHGEKLCTMCQHTIYHNTTNQCLNYLGHDISSSSCCTIRLDIPDPLSPTLPIVHCFRQVHWATSRIDTELL